MASDARGSRSDPALPRSAAPDRRSAHGYRADALDRPLNVLVHEAHRHRALSHGGRDPLDRPAAYVTSGEHAREARLQKKRTAPRESPALEPADLGRQRQSRHHEAVAVELDTAAEPGRVGIRADEEKERAAHDWRVRARCLANTQLPEMAVAVQLHHLGAEMDGHVLDPLDAVDQIARHARVEVLGP